MAVLDSSGDASQTDADADSPDKPHQPKSSAAPAPAPIRTTNLTPSTHPKPSHTDNPPTNYPLPPADSHSVGDKQPGLTRDALERLAAQPYSRPTFSSDDQLLNEAHSNHVRQPSGPSSPVAFHSPPLSPTATSPTDSYWDGPSAPPSRHPSLPSQPPSRASRMYSSPSGDKIAPSVSRDRSSSRGAADMPPVVSSSKSKASSINASDAEDKRTGKFNLKDLLGSTSKLSRKSSQRSTPSVKSADGGQAKSVGTLSAKYGVCQKVAIGKGATSVVRLAHKWDRSEEKLYAIKEFRKRRKHESEKEYVKKLTAEFCISSTLRHPNVVETVDFVQDEKMNWCEVMEFCPGGDLYAAIKKGGMSPSEVECCFKQILNGLSYLHSQGVAHRDIKPENLFFDTKGQLKIGDYGASTVYRLPWEVTVHMSTGLCGSEPYIAPEQFLGKPYDARLVDIWACGIVYYCLHFQELPWRAAQPATDQLYNSYVTACQNPNPAISACPPTINNLSPRPCRPLIRKMLEPNPKLRSTIEDVIAHPWVQGIEVCHDVKDPKHVHVNARAMGVAYLKSLGGKP